MAKDLSKRAKEIIEQIRYVTIASVDEHGLPWNAPVFSAYDAEYNFYWGTHKDSQKARNIANNPHVFLVIYDSTVPAGTGEGVYVMANAQPLVEAKDVRQAFDLLKSRRTTFWDISEVSESGPIRLYKAIPQQAWMNDDGNKDGHYIDIRTEIKLNN